MQTELLTGGWNKVPRNRVPKAVGVKTTFLKEPIVNHFPRCQSSGITYKLYERKIGLIYSLPTVT